MQFKTSKFKISFNHGEPIYVVGKVLKILHSGAIQNIKIQNLLQPWWTNLVGKVLKTLHFGAIQNIKIQIFLQPWWTDIILMILMTLTSCSDQDLDFSSARISNFHLRTRKLHARSKLYSRAELRTAEKTSAHSCHPFQTGDQAYICARYAEN